MAYKRLTKKFENGYVMADCTNCPSFNKCDDRTHYCQTTIKERLAELEAKIEQGTLIELPCKVGDKVYVVYYFPDCWEDPDFEYDILVEKVHDIIITEDGFDIGTECGMIGKFERICVCITREEAEARLKELQE